jgi:hypothetical protein
MMNWLKKFKQTPDGNFHAIWDISADDLKAGTVIDEPKWYCVEINSSVLGADRNGAGLWKLKGKILNDGKFVGVPVQWNYSEKAKSMSTRFVAALGAEIAATGVKLNTDAAQGKRVELFIAPREYEGRLVNDVKDARSCTHDRIPEGNSDNEVTA